jgi:hypothetical protein
MEKYAGKSQKFSKMILKKIFRLGRIRPSHFRLGHTANTGAALHYSCRTLENKDYDEEEEAGRGGGGGGGS